MKDYYKILGVPVSVLLPEVKAAYRKLAHQYHPDKNQDNAYTIAQFHDIQEAYETLSNPRRRALYDEERNYAGMAQQQDTTQAVTPEWLLDVSKKLNASLTMMDVRTISYNKLQSYILLILTDAHLGVLLREPDAEINAAIVAELIVATEKLELKYLGEIMHRLKVIVADDSKAIWEIDAYIIERKKQYLKAKYFPFIILIITLALCLLMYVYSRV